MGAFFDKKNHIRTICQIELSKAKELVISARKLSQIARVNREKLRYTRSSRNASNIDHSYLNDETFRSLEDLLGK